MVQRKIGKTAGRFDMYISSPDGQTFRSKPQLEAYIKKNNLDLSISDFCFTVRGQHILDIVSNGALSINSDLLRNKRKRPEAHVDGRLNDSVDYACTKKVTRRHRRMTPLVRGDAISLKSTEHAMPNTATKNLVVHAKKFTTVMSHRVGGKLLVRMKFSPLTKKYFSSDLDGKPGHFKDSIYPEDQSSVTKVNSSGQNIPASSLSCCPQWKHQKTLCKISMPANGQLSNSCHPKSVNNSGNLQNEISSPMKQCANGFGDTESRKATTKWTPPQSPFNLVEESLFYSSWRILVASIMLENGQDEKTRKAMWKFFKTWPSVEDALGATWQQVYRVLQPFAVEEEICKTLLKFCEEYLTKNWNYPDELHGIKKYGKDAYRIFCINEWKQVAPDNPKLNDYHKWLWQNHRVLGID